jgi:hypothetical protein
MAKRVSDPERDLANQLIAKQQEMITLLERENKELRDISVAAIALAREAPGVMIPFPVPMPLIGPCRCRWWM